jgi:hypothetical protein
LGDAPGRWESFRHLQAQAGTVPVTKRSDKQHVVHFRFACDKALRYVVDHVAFLSLRSSEWARAYYDEQRARGHSHRHALRALGAKWLKIIFVMWQRQTPYDEQYLFATMTRQRLRQQEKLAWHATEKVLLRVGRKRRDEATSQRGQEEAATVHQSITWSARSSSDGGIVRPSTFAVFRLITSSNLVGCSTARLRPLQNPIHVARRAPHLLAEVRAVGEKLTDLADRSHQRHCRQPMAQAKAAVSFGKGK